MSTFIRRNAWRDNGDFSNPDLLWYARAVAVMQSRALDDSKSWWFFAAIHGENIAGDSNGIAWGEIETPPQVPLTPLPSLAVTERFWNQCQHESWYFAPWHRGYLIALEKQIRATIVSLGGPMDWALPYWNYFEPEQDTIPVAFTLKKLPDGMPIRYSSRNAEDPTMTGISMLS